MTSNDSKPSIDLFPELAADHKFQSLGAPVRNHEADLRRACAEMLLSGSLLLADAQRDSANWQQTSMARSSEERFRKALEIGREALS